MDIEKIIIKTTLKTGGKVWAKGSVITKPIPSALIREARAGSKLIEVINAAPVLSSPEKVVVVEPEPVVEEPVVEEPVVEEPVVEEKEEEEKVVVPKKKKISRSKKPGTIRTVKSLLRESK